MPNRAIEQIRFQVAGLGKEAAQQADTMTRQAVAMEVTIEGLNDNLLAYANAAWETGRSQTLQQVLDLIDQAMADEDRATADK